MTRQISDSSHIVEVLLRNQFEEICIEREWSNRREKNGTYCGRETNNMWTFYKWGFISGYNTIALEKPKPNPFDVPC